MKTTSILRLAAASVALSISAHAAEVFSVSTSTTAYPTTTAANFLDGEYDTFVPRTTDSGNGSGWGGGIVTNFDGTTAITPGDQNTAGANTTTYFGPKVYVGVNRDVQQLTAGVIHAYGNGYRIRCNNIGAGLIDSEGVGPSAQAVFMFDADTSSLSGEGDNLIFSGADTLTAKLAVSADMGPLNAGKATAASYRAMVKANGEYYAGTIYNVDLANELTPTNTTQLDMSETGATATWTLMPNMEVADNGIATPTQNLTVDTSESATTVPGYALTNITQVGFLIAATAAENTGGFNYGVREFIAQASPASAPDPIVWSQDFTSPVTILDSLSGLTGYDHAYTWSKAGEGLTATVPSTVTQDETNDQVVLAITENSNAGQVYLHMVGNREQADSTRRVKPVSHDTTWEIDLLAFKEGDSDIMLTTNGFDGYIKSTLAPSGQIKFQTWMADFTHTNFDNFSGPSKLRNNANNPGIVIVSGGTFDPASADPVTITISGNAEGTVNMNTALDAVESVTLTNYGSGYTAQPTVTFAGGGMTVAPEISFNYSTGNLGGTVVKTVDLGLEIIPQENGNKFWGVMNDGQIFTYTQSYDSANDSLSYYFSLTNKATGVVNGPHFITTLTAAEHSAGGLGFFDVISGKRWPETPANQKAIEVHLKRYSNADYASATTIGINSISVATIDGDRDGVIDRNDAFPTDPLESVDSDSDGTGDNSDQYDGYNDTVMTTLGSAQSTAADTFSYYVNGNWVNATNLDAWLTANNYSTGGGGGAITQEAYDAALADKAAAETSLANAREARAGSTVIDVANDVATITLTVEQTDNVGDWSSATTSDYDIELGAPAGASFYRFTIPE
jgi:hypothetical protein